MALLNILEYPDPRLRNKAVPVARVDDRIRQLIDDMFETMYDAPGIGLAASQVDVHQRIIIVDVSEQRDEPYAFVNPTLTLAGDVIETEEGCLSVPGYYEPVTRRERTTVSALDREGKPFELDRRALFQGRGGAQRDRGDRAGRGGRGGRGGSGEGSDRPRRRPADGEEI